MKIRYYLADGQAVESVAPVYRYDYVMYKKDRPGQIGNKRVEHDWRRKIKQGKNLMFSLIPTDDKLFVLKIFNQIKFKDSWIIETQLGQHDIDFVLDGGEDIGATGENFDWLEDDTKKKWFAFAWIGNYGNHIRAIQAAYHRNIKPKYYARILEILADDDVVQNEVRHLLHKVMEEEGFDLISLIRERCQLYREVKNGGQKAYQLRNRMIKEMMADVENMNLDKIDEDKQVKKGMSALAKMHSNIPAVQNQLASIYQRKRTEKDNKKVIRRMEKQHKETVEALDE